MPRFAYTARDRAGKSVSADLEAPSRKDALRLLTARGLQASAVTELASGPAGKRAAPKSPSPPPPKPASPGAPPPSSPEKPSASPSSNPSTI